MTLRRLLLALALLAGTPAVANDSTAELGAGGLVFVINDDVSMESEDLYVSVDEVRVDYRFLNTAAEERTVTVAFPMPDLEGSPFESFGVPDPEQDNFLDFEVLVDGRPVAVNLQQRAFAAGVDVTAMLGEAGVPLMPFAPAAREAVEALDAEVLERWLRLGILVKNTYDDDGTGMKDHYEPYWTLKTTYYWEMAFPPGREVRVQHRYRPSVGGTAGLSFLEDGKLKDRQYDVYRQKYCLDGGFEKAISRLVTPADPYGGGAMENRLSYILTTGRNWQGTIKRFRLTVDKGAPSNIVSFCAEGVKKTGPTTFEVVHDDFYPLEDLHVLIVVPPAN